ncbi:MAG: diaminopimelate decarboxylase [Acidobacteria bacterium]|nr:diaminopimelate decarboxylase [Acidobacteriota bacterium]
MNNFFAYRNGTLRCEGVPLTRVAARVSTPTYVYSQSAIEAALDGFAQVFAAVPHTLCYAVKANSNLALLRLIGAHGAGFDIVSGGELFRLRRAGLRARRVVFSGVGKTVEEVDFALRAGILFFHLESADELALIAERARHLRQRARVAVRVNPNVDPATHPHISTGSQEHKFGVPLAETVAVCRRVAAEPWLEFVGIGCHIGSQITRLAPVRRALARLRQLTETLRRQGLAVRYLDIGGGVGIRYDREKIFPLSAYAAAVKAATRGLDSHLILEPGRSIDGPAGLLLTRVLVRKRGRRKTFLVVDAGMSDLLRPALYGARHRILPVSRTQAARAERVDVVGPLCETTDCFARDVRLPRLPRGALLALCDVGAYGFSLASNYNSRPRPAEVLISRNRMRTVREREQWGDLVRREAATA